MYNFTLLYFKMGDPLASRTASGSEAQSRSSREQGLERLERWGTCVPLPFHVTGGQPAVGQGVVIHARERDLLRNLTLLYFA
ncbi:unnamed protein product [Spirodela intermedia]|uniref:Uncharacterized protein n=1 Tax=Spirodela intermedia TaxID=51605 RepID=A0ABN7E9T7_SPIIN|nr:unnamed protein product [Spirodela intermedia]